MNNVSLIGRLVQDPATKAYKNDKVVCIFTIAVDRKMNKSQKDLMKKNGKNTADFLRIVTWDNIAKSCQQYLSKGQKIAVEGTIQTSAYKDKQNQMKYTYDIIAKNIEFLESKKIEKLENEDLDEDFPAF